MQEELNSRNADIDQIALAARGDGALLAELIAGLKLKVSPRSGQETVRYNCFKALMAICDLDPAVLYPSWDLFAAMLGSQNSYNKMAAVQLIAGVVAADTQNRFDALFDEYYGMLDDDSMIVAIFVASASGRIVKAKPALEPRISAKLLAIPQTHHTDLRKGLIVAGAIEAFDQYIDQASDRQSIIRFVGHHEGSSSPKTRKLAKEFLKKWG